MSEQEENEGLTAKKAKGLLTAFPGGLPEKIIQWIILNKVVISKKTEEQQNEGE